MTKTVDGLSNRTAYKLLRRALAVVSMQNGFRLELCKFSNGHVCILTEDRELASVICMGSTTIYFDSAEECLTALMQPGTTFIVSPLKKTEPIIVDFSKEVGSSVDEIKIRLDLLEAKPK